jgi:uncharacterized membrane protein YjjB (DUF3815 family)
MIAPLVTFLPGAALTMAVVELSAAEMITGASRLVAGSVQLLLLAFGITGAAQVVGLPSADALVDTPATQVGWWAPWLGVLLVGIGNYLYFSAPPRSLGWLCLVLYVAWIGQYLGDLAFGGYLSGFVGAIVMTPVAYLVERRPSGPPALVSFLPAFWLLVPGALGLIGVTEYLGKDAVAGVQDFLGAVGSMVAIGLGVLCGYPLYRSLARSLGWLQELGPAESSLRRGGRTCLTRQRQLGFMRRASAAATPRPRVAAVAVHRRAPPTTPARPRPPAAAEASSPRPVASASFSASTAATSSCSRLRSWTARLRRCSSDARSASSSHRRVRSTRAARSGGHDRARWPASCAVRTNGSCVPVVVRVSRSSAPASASQADLLRDLQISQTAASPTTTTTSSVQPRAPNPWDSAAAGVPAVDDADAVVGASASADVLGGVVAGDVGGAADVGTRVDVGVAALVWGDRVGAVAVMLAGSVTLGAGAGALGRGAGRRNAPAAGVATAEPEDQTKHEPCQQP